MDDHFSFAPDDPVRAQLGLGVAALRYQQLGYAVLPLAREGKKPHRMLPLSPEGRGGVHWATRDQRMPPWAWAQDRAAGVGVATGSASQLLVIDLDVKGTSDGRAELSAFMGQYQLSWDGEPPIVATPSGGQHLWFRTPPGVAVGQRLGILPGVDIKGDGGYVVAPPSMIRVRFGERPGERGEGSVLIDYSWYRGCPCSLPMAPLWLFTWIQTTPQLGSAAGLGAASGEPVDLEELKQTGLPVGERNVGLYRTACSLFGRYGTDAAGQRAVWAQLEPVLTQTEGFRTSFGDHEISVVIASARKFIERQRLAERERSGETFGAWQQSIRGW